MLASRGKILALGTGLAAIASAAYRTDLDRVVGLARSISGYCFGVYLGPLPEGRASALEQHAILPDVISKEPLGPVVRRGDDEFFAIAKWVVFALVEAEEYGITQANVDDMKTSSDPVVGRILGTGEDTGKLLGLDKEWAYRAIKAVGNYGDIFERNVGPKSALGLPRGVNNLWNKGGIMYAPPVR